MRKTLGMVLLTCAVAGFVTVPAVTAFHGAPYTALGWAYWPVTGETYDAELWWSGQTYTLKLYEDDGTLFHQNTFQGDEAFSNVRITTDHDQTWCTTNSGAPGSLEFTDYVGQGTVLPLHSDHLGIRGFYIEGFQMNCLSNGQAIMVYDGNYLNFELHLVV